MAFALAGERAAAHADTVGKHREWLPQKKLKGRVSLSD